MITKPGDPQPSNIPSTAAEHSRLMQQLREVNERLIIATVEAQQKTEQLAESDRRKNEFIAMLAHELRNPLMPIRTAVEILKRDPNLTTKTRWACDIIDRQLHHLVHLVDDLLDIARLSRGKISLQRRPLDLREVIASAIEVVKPSIDKHSHQLTVSLNDVPLTVEGDPDRLLQVMVNLLDNADKYTDPGGRIEITAQREASEIVMRVRDTGIGISTELLPRVFETFVQEAQSLDRPRGGLGLGLPLVRQFVELHGGSVQAASKGCGKGSEFVVRLPALSSGGT